MHNYNENVQNELIKIKKPNKSVLKKSFKETFYSNLTFDALRALLVKLFKLR